MSIVIFNALGLSWASDDVRITATKSQATVAIYTIVYIPRPASNPVSEYCSTL